MTTGGVRCAAACAVVVLTTASACSGAADGNESAPVESTLLPGKGTILLSPSLDVRVDPSGGPVGTTVQITATGCNDPKGDSHAISFNNDSRNSGARNGPNTVRPIVSTQEGTTLRGSYTIQPADRTGGVGSFFVQCGGTTNTVDFTVLTS